jgi:hypothetical protein
VYGGEGASRNTATFSESRERRAGPALAIACQQNNVKYHEVWAGNGYTVRLRGASATCRAVCLGGPPEQNSAQKHSFSNRTTHRFYFHPAHGGELYALTSMYVW